MADKLIGAMENLDFEQMINAYIDRPATVDDAIPAELVFAMLDQAEKAHQALALESIVVQDRLVISAQANTILPSHIREIELNLPNMRLIVKVEPLAI